MEKRKQKRAMKSCEYYEDLFDEAMNEIEESATAYLGYEDELEGAIEKLHTAFYGITRCKMK